MLHEMSSSEHQEGKGVGGVTSVRTDAATNVSCETASNEDVCTPTEWRR